MFNHCTQNCGVWLTSNSWCCYWPTWVVASFAAARPTNAVFLEWISSGGIANLLSSWWSILDGPACNPAHRLMDPWKAPGLHMKEVTVRDSYWDFNQLSRVFIQPSLRKQESKQLHFRNEVRKGKGRSIHPTEAQSNTRRQNTIITTKRSELTQGYGRILIQRSCILHYQPHCSLALPAHAWLFFLCGYYSQS